MDELVPYGERSDPVGLAENFYPILSGRQLQDGGEVDDLIMARRLGG